jgi:hypothetical protein
MRRVDRLRRWVRATVDLPETRSAPHTFLVSNSKHPNRVPFEGCLTKLDTPSDKAPSGARGHRVVLTETAAIDALDSLIGMAVAFSSNWAGHDARQKCGVISEAWVEDDELRIRGYLYARDFPEVAVEMRKVDVEMGMSYELCDAHVEDMRASIWKLTKVTFTGAAILRRDRAAYRGTRISLSAVAEDAKFTGRLEVVGHGSVRLGRDGRLQQRRRPLRSGRASH